MALSDEAKLQFTKQTLVEWVYNFQDWASLKAALQGLTKAQVKNFILNALSVQAAADLASSTDKDDLHTEVTNDI